MTDFDFDAPPPYKVTSRPYKSSGEKAVRMNVFDEQMVEAKMVFHAEGHETGLNLLVTEIHWPPNNVTLPHIHELEDESFFILEGALTIRIGPPDQEREVIELSKGEFGWAPRNTGTRSTWGPMGRSCFSSRRRAASSAPTSGSSGRRSGTSRPRRSSLR
jgi:quercetin dioxygenase-like cupin family protein